MSENLISLPDEAAVSASTPATAELEVVSRPPNQAERRIKKLYSDLCGISKEVSTEILKATKRALRLAIDLGGLLIEHKERIGHGNWEPCVAAQEFSLATAKRWMALHRRRNEVARSGVEGLDEAYRILGLKTITPKRSPVSDLTDPESTDTPATQYQRTNGPLLSPLPEKPAMVTQEAEPPVQSEQTPVSDDGDPAAELKYYTVDATVTIRVIRHADAHNEEDAIRLVKRAYKEGLERHLQDYLKTYRNCDEIDICSMTWSATE